MNYPLQLNFKKLALAHQVAVTDAGGTLIWYIKQKAFKLREQVTVFADREQTRPLFEVEADRVIDFSALYTIRAIGGSSGGSYTGSTMIAGTPKEVGRLQRRGVKSFWKAHYEIERAGATVFGVEEENPWAKFADGLLCEIPLLGLVSGYLFHPRYLVSTTAGEPVLRVEKKPAFLEGRFDIEKIGNLSDGDEPLVLLSIMMIVLLERSRG